jgi:imidazolonepropionase-like amidohydrolase
MPAHSSTVIRDVRIFDGTTVRPRRSVVLHEGVIAEIGADVIAPSGAEVIDGTGRTLLPGLIDAHTHVAAGSLEQALAFGVTTELDMFADPRLAAELKKRAAAEDQLADLRSAGTCATAPGGHPTGLVQRGLYPPFPTLSDPAAASAFVADRVAEGSDHIKIIIDDGQALGYHRPTLTGDTVHALVAAARQNGKLAIVHAIDHGAVRLAADAGADGLAHLPVDTALAPELAARIAGAGMFVISTLVTAEAICGHGHGPRTAADPRFASHLDQTSLMMLTMAGGNFPLGAGAHVEATAPAAALRVLHDYGVPILAGTDAGTLGVAHGASLHRELQLLTDAGLSPAEALTAATAAPAARFGLGDRGRIAPGLTADLLLVDGDPTTDIIATANIHAIWRRGTRHNR